jgi:uncharacterized membrane protein YeaQ/YmgE (transglycosylase-associated protein family)
MNLLVLIVFGAIVGWLTSVIMGRNAQQGIIADIILGILGALAGGLIMDFFGAPGVTGFNLYSFIVALIGAVLLVLIGRALERAF